jgi:hypothetical protein
MGPAERALLTEEEELAVGEADASSSIKRNAARKEGLDEAVESVLQWWRRAHAKHVGYTASGRAMGLQQARKRAT